MKRLRPIGLRAVLVGVMICLGIFVYFYQSRDREANADPLEGLTNWNPSAAALHHSIDELPATPADSPARRQRFADTLTHRYRNHEPRMAVRIRFRGDNMIFLLCPARMEPWNMDRLAMSVWEEAKDDLERDFRIDIFLTFIGSAPIKIGELRSIPGTPQKVHIRYRNATGYDKAPHVDNQPITGSGVHG